MSENSPYMHRILLVLAFGVLCGLGGYIMHTVQDKPVEPPSAPLAESQPRVENPPEVDEASCGQVISISVNGHTDTYCIPVGRTVTIDGATNSVYIDGPEEESQPEVEEVPCEEESENEATA